jgi:hypothetical protein
VFTTVRQYRCRPEDAHDDCGGGDLMTMTVFTDRDASMRSNELAAEFINEHLADTEITRTASLTGEVLVNRAKSDMMELVHA